MDRLKFYDDLGVPADLRGKVSDVWLDMETCVVTGGFSAVFHGTYCGEPAFVKVIRLDPAIFPDVETLRAVLGGEIQASIKLHSPLHVVTVCGIVYAFPSESEMPELGDKSAPELWLAMDLVEGKSLQEVITQATTLGVLSEEQSAEKTRFFLCVLYCLAVDLEFIHARDFAHLDLTPGNVMLMPRRDPSGFCTKLIDFGSARSVGGETLQVGIQSKLTLAQGYAPFELVMAAEEAQRKVPVHERTRLTTAVDIYSWGMIALHLLTGKSAAALSVLPLEHRTRLLNAVPHVPAELVPLIMSTFAYEPTERPTARQLRGKFGTVLEIDIRRGVASAGTWTTRLLTTLKARCQLGLLLAVNFIFPFTHN